MPTDIKNHDLALRKAGAWTSLVLLCADSKSPVTATMLDRIGEVMSLEEERHTVLSIDLMKADDELSALRAHSERLFSFLSGVLKICNECNVTAALPHAESVHEYVEAWDAREKPTDAELRRRFSELARQCSERALQ